MQGYKFSHYYEALVNSTLGSNHSFMIFLALHPLGIPLDPKEVSGGTRVLIYSDYESHLNATLGSNHFF